jgi:hypothetical protein
MSDEPPLIFRRVLGSLRPANAAAEQAMAAIDDKPIRVRITKTTGNVRRNGLYWSVLALAAPMLSERIEGDALNPELLHRILKDRAGLVRTITLPSGDIIKDYESISFAKMTEPQRAQFIDWSLATLSKWLGVSASDLRREAQEQEAA